VRGETLLRGGRGFSIDLSAGGRYIAALAMAGFLLFLYAPTLLGLIQQWWTDPDYGYCFLVPVLSVWILWQGRKRWRTACQRPSFLGLVIILFAMGLLIAGTLGAERFTARISLLILLCGIIVFVAGRGVLRSVAFPLAYLVFMIPLPAIVFYQLTVPLQLLASRLGAHGLTVLGVRTLREGNLLILPNCTLEVLESCSGIRSLLCLLATVTAYGHFAQAALWKRCVLIILVFPIAILCNGLRLVATGLLCHAAGPQADSGVFHLALGVGFFLLAFFMTWLADEGLCCCTLRLSPRLPS
jgi:exosortase